MRRLLIPIALVVAIFAALIVAACAELQPQPTPARQAVIAHDAVGATTAAAPLPSPATTPALPPTSPPAAVPIQDPAPPIPAGSANPRSQAFVNGAIQVLSQPDVQSQVAEGIRLGLANAPPPYGLYGALGLLLAKDVVGWLKLKNANQTAQTAITANAGKAAAS